jgi:hypothetical protein
MRRGTSKCIGHEYPDHYRKPPARRDDDPAGTFAFVFLSTTLATTPLPNKIRTIVPTNSPIKGEGCMSFVKIWLNERICE